MGIIKYFWNCNYFCVVEILSVSGEVVKSEIGEGCRLGDYMIFDKRFLGFFKG